LSRTMKEVLKATPANSKTKAVRRKGQGREYYIFDDKGRPEAYKNLDKLRERVRPLILRRRKADVETELPDRTDRNFFVSLTPVMRDEYTSYEKQIADLVRKSKRRPLTPREQDLLMVLLNIMRMICDSPSIVKNNPCRDCPKLDELARVLEESLSDPDVKIIVFSEWERMLDKVRVWAEQETVGYAWHTGSVPQKRRRAEIRFCLPMARRLRLRLPTNRSIDSAIFAPSRRKRRAPLRPSSPPICQKKRFRISKPPSSLSPRHGPSRTTGPNL
jgi:SNF2-related domain